MQNLIRSVKKSVQGKNWYGALFLSLSLPDICGKIEDEARSVSDSAYSKRSSVKRYSEWFDKYLQKKYLGNVNMKLLTGEDFYAFRCSLLHEGSDNIKKQQAKKF